MYICVLVVMCVLATVWNVYCECVYTGRFSTVFRARYSYQERHGGPLGSIVVAVKEPSVAYAADFKREIEIMAKIKHHNIVRLIGIVQRKSPHNVRELIVPALQIYKFDVTFIFRCKFEPYR